MLSLAVRGQHCNRPRDTLTHSTSHDTKKERGQVPYGPYTYVHVFRKSNESSAFCFNAFQLSRLQKVCEQGGLCMR
eukprot:3964223-Pleurochrysis_carterae.AAC.1